MSAFVVSHDHIDALLTFASDKRMLNELSYRTAPRRLTATEIGRVLLAENERLCVALLTRQFFHDDVSHNGGDRCRWPWSWGLFPPPAFGERRHRNHARRLVAVRRRAVLMVAESERPHPGRTDWRGVHLHDAVGYRPRWRGAKPRCLRMRLVMQRRTTGLPGNSTTMDLPERPIQNHGERNHHRYPIVLPADLQPAQ
jgi:hypothetical protein